MFKPLPIQQALEATARGGTETGRLLMVNPNGDDLVFTVIATLAMRLFGLNLSSLTLALTCFMGTSTLVFLLRYQDNRVFAVALYFFTLTVMLFTPLATDSDIVNELPLGGIRYFTLVGILPAMHIFWEIVEPAKSDLTARPGNFILLGIQVIVLAVVILVRGSAGYLLGALIVAFFLALRARHHDPAALRNLLRKGAFIAFLSGVLGASFYLWVPQAYKDSGQITGVFWHRMVISLGANPAWPFGDLRDVYAPCKPYHPSLYATPAEPRSRLRRLEWPMHLGDVRSRARPHAGGNHRGYLRRPL